MANQDNKKLNNNQTGKKSNLKAENSAGKTVRVTDGGPKEGGQPIIRNNKINNSPRTK